jgi:hypothetical protein
MNRVLVVQALEISSFVRSGVFKVTYFLYLYMYKVTSRHCSACMPMPATTTTESLPETTTITADDTSKCSLVPLVFSSDASCNGGFHPGPCPSEELLSVKVVYYDWNVQECHDSHLKICPGTEANIFNDFNAFRTQFQCHEGLYFLLLSKRQHYN